MLSLFVLAPVLGILVVLVIEKESKVFIILLLGCRREVSLISVALCCFCSVVKSAWLRLLSVSSRETKLLDDWRFSDFGVLASESDCFYIAEDNCADSSATSGITCVGIGISKLLSDVFWTLIVSF